MYLFRTLTIAALIASTSLLGGCGSGGVGTPEVIVQPSDPSGMPRNRRQRELMEEKMQEQAQQQQGQQAPQQQ